jgi:rod shape-determining protein MreD
MSLLVSDKTSASDRVRHAAPAASVFLASLAMALPLPLAIGLLPNLPLLFVIIWASIQPRLMPVWGGFVLGLVYDLIVGVPFGHYGLLFALAVIGVRLVEARTESHALFVDWLFASAILLILSLLSWQIFAFVGMEAPLLLILLQALATLLCYPLVAALVARIQRRIVDDIG